MTRPSLRPSRLQGSKALRYFLFAAGVVLGIAGAGQAQAAGLYEVAHIPVDRTAASAVEAQHLAMHDAEASALTIVFHRLVPFSDYAKLPKLSSRQINDLVSDVSVEHERYSATRYIARLDISFSRQGVRDLLQQDGISISEKRAPGITILPVVIDNGQVESDGAEGWWTDWWRFDFAHSLTPARLVRAGRSFDLAALKSVLDGNKGALDRLQQDYGGSPLLIAVAERATDAQGNDVLISRLVGSDAVGEINYGRKDPIYDGDVKGAAQQAATLLFGVIENRWKVMGKAPQVASMDQAGGGAYNGGSGGTGGGSVVPRNVVAQVQFAGLAGWQAIRSRLTGLSGVQDFEVNSLSARTALVTFDYVGSLGTLQRRLQQNGITFQASGNGFVLRADNAQ